MEKNRERIPWSHRCAVTSVSINLSLLNLNVNFSLTLFLDPNLVPPSLDDLDLRGKGKESHTSLEGELEAQESGEAMMRLTEEVAARKAVKTSAFFISEWSPLSTAVIRRTFRCPCRSLLPASLMLKVVDEATARYVVSFYIFIYWFFLFFIFLYKKYFYIFLIY